MPETQCWHGFWLYTSQTAVEVITRWFSSQLLTGPARQVRKKDLQRRLRSTRFFSPGCMKEVGKRKQ